MNQFVCFKLGTSSYSQFGKGEFEVTKIDDKMVSLTSNRDGIKSSITVPLNEIEGLKIPCKMCGISTHRTGTKRCDNCWEVETRIRNMNHTVLLNILHTRFSHVYLHNHDASAK